MNYRFRFSGKEMKFLVSEQSVCPGTTPADRNLDTVRSRRRISAENALTDKMVKELGPAHDLPAQTALFYQHLFHLNIT